MQKIILNTAVVSNDGQRIESGVEVAVGDDPKQIAAHRAETLISTGQAADATPVEAAPKKETAKK